MTTVEEADLYERAFGAPEAVETDVYRLYDRSMNLLYVGKSVDWQSRTNQHKRRPWWREVRFVEIVTYPSEQDAWEAENTAIKTEDPVHNLQGTVRDPRRLPRGPRKPRVIVVPPTPVSPVIPLPAVVVLDPAPSTGPVIASDEDLQIRILRALERLAVSHPSSSGFHAGEITRKVIDGIPRRHRSGTVRSRISTILKLLANDSRSPVQRFHLGTNPVNKLPILAYGLIPPSTTTPPLRF